MTNFMGESPPRCSLTNDTTWLVREERSTPVKRLRIILQNGSYKIHCNLINTNKITVAEELGLFDGLLANDKFCMSRHVRLSLSYSRRPNLTRRRTDWATDARAYPPAGITRHGGDDETALARTSGNSETPGREATLGPGLPGHPAVEPGKRADSRSGRKRQGGLP